MTDTRLALLDQGVAAAASEWLDDPRDAEVYIRLVSAVEARRRYLAGPPGDVPELRLGAVVPAGRAGTDDRVATAVDGSGRNTPADGRPTKADKTRVRILDAAARVFSRKGFTEARLSDIAAEAKIHPGSLYYHFRNREELVDEVLRVGQERIDGYVRERVGSLPPDTADLGRLAVLITAQLETVLEIGDYTRATIRIIGQVPEDVHRRHLHHQRQYGDYWRGMFRRAQEGGTLRGELDLSAMMMLILGALNSTPDWYRPRKDIPPTELGAMASTVFLRGLATEHVMAGAPEPGTGTAHPATPASARPGPSVTRARILDAAARILREQGYGGTRIRNVAAVAGLRPSSLYHHFHSRDDLVAGLFDEAWEQANELVRRAVAELPAGATPLEQVSAAVRAHLLSVLSPRSYSSGLLHVVGQLPDDVRRPSLARQWAFTRYWRQLLASAQEAGEVRRDIDVPTVAMMIVGSCNWAVEWFQPDGRLDPPALASQFTTMLLGGLARPAGAG